MFARTLLTGLRDDEDEDDEDKDDEAEDDEDEDDEAEDDEANVEPVRRLLELLAIELSDLSIECGIGLFASGLGVVCLLVAVSGSRCSLGVIVERLSEEARKDRLMQVGCKAGEQIGQSMSWL
jgi:hypothetical protein